MVDRFIERVAELSGQTCRTLEELAKVMDESGLPHASVLRNIAKTHAQIALDCLSETQPIEVQRYNLTDRIKMIIKSMEELSSDLLSRNKRGHAEVDEAISFLRLVLEEISVDR